jgi:hypothetical protein
MEPIVVKARKSQALTLRPVESATGLATLALWYTPRCPTLLERDDAWLAVPASMVVIGILCDGARARGAAGVDHGAVRLGLFVNRRTLELGSGTACRRGGAGGGAGGDGLWAEAVGRRRASPRIDSR